MLPSTTNLLICMASLCLQHTFSAFNPRVNVTACSQSSIKFTLEGAENGGIVYIQGQWSACMQQTTNITRGYEFDLALCSVDAYLEFHIVVQKKAHYQTGHDLRLPISCLLNIFINSGDSLNMDDGGRLGEGINATVRPTVGIKLSSGGRDVTSTKFKRDAEHTKDKDKKQLINVNDGGPETQSKQRTRRNFLFKYKTDGKTNRRSRREVDGSPTAVQLGDDVTMHLQMGSEYSDFDILAKECTADGIILVNDFCTSDAELFPMFTSNGQGLLTTTFRAFRPTNLEGSSVNMAISCTLHACLGPCTPVTCVDSELGYGRKKRQAPDTNIAYDNINVGAILRVGSPVLPKEKDIVVDDTVCMSMEILIFVAVLLFVSVTLSSATVYIKCSKKLEQHSTKRKSKTASSIKRPLKLTISTDSTYVESESGSQSKVSSNATPTKQVSGKTSQAPQRAIDTSSRTVAEINPVPSAKTSPNLRSPAVKSSHMITSAEKSSPRVAYIGFARRRSISNSKESLK